jgi:xanthine dehydrogenase accessory factor
MPNHAEILAAATARQARGEVYAVATVVEAVGSTSGRCGDKAVIDAAGDIAAGWVGGGCAEATIRQVALECLGDAQARLVTLDLDDEVLGVGMPCGGSMCVFVEPVLPQPTLWLLGRGRVVETLCRFGARLGFRVVVNHVGPPDPLRFPDAAVLIGDDDLYDRLTPAATDCVVIATQHRGDHLSAVRALRSPAAHVALIASRKRTRLIRDFLRDEGFSESELARLHAPAGLDLGARTPDEIALSVLAEIVLRRRGGTGRPLAATAPEPVRRGTAAAREPARAS